MEDPSEKARQAIRNMAMLYTVIVRAVRGLTPPVRCKSVLMASTALPRISIYRTRYG
jgi:hypothetical protein